VKESDFILCHALLSAQTNCTCNVRMCVCVERGYMRVRIYRAHAEACILHIALLFVCECAAVCCSVLQCVAVRCSVLQCIAGRCRVFI